MITVVILVLTLTLGAAGCGPPRGPMHYVAAACDPLYHPSPGEAGPPLIRWFPNGTHILFGSSDQFGSSAGLYLVDSKGLTLRQFVDANPNSYVMRHGLHADVSPDGSRVVYTSCEYPTQEKHRSKYSVHRYPDWRDDPMSYHYEIAISNIDGTGKHRLTENTSLDHYPAWSPDGNQIAVISYFQASHDRPASGYTLYTIAPDGSNARILTPTFPKNSQPKDTEPRNTEVHRWSVYRWSPPKWSPDGERIAFLVSEPHQISLYTATVDGSNLNRVAATRYEPSWSPDGRRLAFLADWEDGLALLTAAADGSDIRETGRWDAGFSAISWSPRGSELMLIPIYPSGGIIFVVGMDGSMIGQFRGDYAAWSPDGSRIAVFTSNESRSGLFEDTDYEATLSTIALDGTDIRVLAKRETIGGESSWVPVGSGDLTLADRMARCEMDAVVPNPADNPGLVEDCKTLLTVRSALQKGAPRWGSEAPISEWVGVVVGGSPPRVEGLSLGERAAETIAGPLRPEIGRLLELRSLAVYGNLWGPIPPEWGNLSELRELILDSYAPVGIPPELGNLKRLETLKVPHVGFLEASECVPASLVTSLVIEGDSGLGYRVAWDDFETIEDVNSRFGTELKPC